MTKRRKLQNQSRAQTQAHEEEALLPGLPDHVAHLILSRLRHRPSLLFSVSRSWRQLLYSPSFPPFLSLYALMRPSQPSDRSESESGSESARFYEFDPISSTWRDLPAPPAKLLLRHRSFISRTLPVQSVAVAGKLVLLAGTAGGFSPALTSPLVFDPAAGRWSCGPGFLHPRRWCAAGACGGAVIVASGIGTTFASGVARSAEKWVVESGPGSAGQKLLPHSPYGRGGPAGTGSGWVKLRDLRDGRLSREAIEAVGWRGKLCMVNVKGSSAKEGAVYDVAGDEWSEMSPEMISGWRGPAAALDETHLFVVDEVDGTMRRFEPETRRWEAVSSSPELVGAEQAAAGGGRVCVVGKGGGIVVVDVTSSPARSWAVEPPRGMQAVAVHVLPRMIFVL